RRRSARHGGACGRPSASGRTPCASCELQRRTSAAPNSTTGQVNGAPPNWQAARGENRVSRGATSPRDNSDGAPRAQVVVLREMRNRVPVTQSEERAAQNEISFREANEKLNDKRAKLGVEGLTPFLCECSDPHCTELIRLTLPDYEDVRSHPARFLVAVGHN